MESRFTYQVEPDEKGQRLDNFLAEKGLDLTRSRLKKLINEGHALVDGEAPKAGKKLKTGQTVILNLPEVKVSPLEPDETVEFGILYQDSDIVVINKPPGLVVHPAAGHQTGTLVHGLLAVCEDLKGVGGEIRPGIVHRLDKDTSGVMVVAKNDDALAGLLEQFKESSITKHYLAICRGWPREAEGEINEPIGRHPHKRKKMSIYSRSGRPAITRFTVKRRFGNGTSLLRLHILTGRTHQIRVHLSSIGCPVLGDQVYGVGLGWMNRGREAYKGLLKRQMLHARLLKFQHPVTEENMSFEAPIAPDMELFLKALEENEVK